MFPRVLQLTELLRIDVKDIGTPTMNGMEGYKTHRKESASSNCTPPLRDDDSPWVRLTTTLEDAYFRILANIRHFSSPLTQVRHDLPEKLIVSLTSFPPRFPTLHLTVKTLLSQDLRPDLVVLWLYEPDLERLPDSTRRLVGELFEVRTVPRDIRSYKKLIPSLREFPSAFIVTADDDTYYDRHWLRELVSCHKVGAHEVLGHRAHRIPSGPDNGIPPYSRWESMTLDRTPDKTIFLTGTGGILYPPHALDEEVFNEDAFMRLCPTADDIWFYFMLRKRGFVCRKVGRKFVSHNWAGTGAHALFHANFFDNKNDEAIENLVREYGNPIQ